ncbi:beta-1,3-galactosyltransferase 1-like [Neosynchiropus ocellatus]
MSETGARSCPRAGPRDPDGKNPEVHQSPPKKPVFRFWFHLMVLLSLAGLVMCFVVFNKDVSIQGHYRRIFNWTSHVGRAPPYRPDPFQYHLAYPRNYAFTMDVPEVCRVHKPFLVMMVPVAPTNVAARDAIRQTWGKAKQVQGKTVLTLFVLGKSHAQEALQQELACHRDLIQSDFVDSYLNLTIKTMVIMDWLATRCPEAEYAMKVDSDMFININNLVIMLKIPTIPKTNYLTGRLMWNRPVIRSRKSKWYVPEEMYPESSYPTYTLGMGYVFSNDLPGKLVEICKTIKPFNIEDAYVGLCMKALGLPITAPPDPRQFRDYNFKYNRCQYSKVITYILRTSEELIRYWADLNQPGPPCQEAP